MRSVPPLLLPALGLLTLVACSKQDAATAPVAAPTELAAIHTPPPVYPVELACAGAGGTTVLKVTVGTEGKPTEVLLVTSSGQPALDESAQKAVHDWQFRAATRNGQAMPQTIQVPVAFNPPQPRPDECFAIEERARRGG